MAIRTYLFKIATVISALLGCGTLFTLFRSQRLLGGPEFNGYACTQNVYCPTCGFLDAETCSKSCRIFGSKIPGHSEEDFSYSCRKPDTTGLRLDRAQDTNVSHVTREGCKFCLPDLPSTINVTVKPALEPITKIVHIVSVLPFKSLEKTIVLSSIHSAVAFAQRHGIVVQVVIVNMPTRRYQQRPDMLQDEFLQTSFFKASTVLRTAADLDEFFNQADETFVPSVLQADIFAAAQPFRSADYIVWTNIGISLRDDFYKQATLLAQVHRAASLTQVPLEGFTTLEAAYLEARTSELHHDGQDCIIFEGRMLKYIQASMGHVLAGVAGVEQAIRHSLHCALDRTQTERHAPYTGLYPSVTAGPRGVAIQRPMIYRAKITFHIGEGKKDMEWKNCGSSVSKDSLICVQAEFNRALVDKLEATSAVLRGTECPEWLE